MQVMVKMVLFNAGWQSNHGIGEACGHIALAKKFFPIAGDCPGGAKLAVPPWAWQAMLLQNEITFGNRNK
jgi:hypothetical protein